VVIVALNMSSSRDSARTLVGVATVVAVLGTWVIGSKSGWINPQVLPSPEQFWAAAKQLTVGEGFADGRVHEHVLQSVKLILMGFFAATAVGVPLGLWMGWSRKAEALPADPADSGARLDSLGHRVARPG
jgi:taurine transport system permease protein